MSAGIISSTPVQAAAGFELLHPGGFELTSQAVAAGAFGSGERVLDIGCGCGMTVSWLAQSFGASAAGVDVRLPALQDGQAHSPRISLACARAEQLPFGSETWEGLLAECSLSAMCNLDLVLAECYRVLVFGGRLVITDLYRRRPSPGSDELMVLDQAGWLTRLEGRGFFVCRWEDHTQDLKVWAAREILAGRSLASLWGGCPPAGIGDAPALARLHVGYFLLVAQKNDP